MKHIDYLYFNIYNYFYRTSQDSQGFNTRIQTMYLFTIGSGGWILFLQAFYLHLWRHAWFSSQAQSAVFAVSVYLLTAVLFNYIFIIRHRDLQIFGKYEETANQNPKRKWHLVLSFGVLAVPYLALLSFAILFPHH